MTHAAAPTPNPQPVLGAVAAGPARGALVQLATRPELWLWLLVFSAGAYFHGSGSWNQNARLDAIFAFVEPGPHQWTFRIDDFLPRPDKNFNTGDWSRFGDHYYANKAPGTLWLGALAYLPLQRLEAALGVDLDSPPIAALNAHWINVWVSVLPMSVAIVALFRHLVRQTPARWALVISVLSFFGTALFPYATQLWGHTTAAAFVLLSLVALLGAPGQGAPPRVVALCWAKLGALSGAASCCDFLAAPFVVGLVLIALLRGRWAAVGLVAGGAPLALLLLGYQWVSFGDPFALPTSGMNQAFVDDERALGMFGGLAPTALWQSTFGAYRGVFYQMPILLAAALGHVFWWRRRPKDPVLWLSVGVFVASLLWLATFNGWHGGATVCARYLIVSLPALLLGLAELPRNRLSYALVSVLGAASSLAMLAVASVSPLAPERLPNPLFSETFPRFFAGEHHPYVLPVRLVRLHPDFERWSTVTVWNGGDIVGLSGAWRVAPLLALALGCLVLLWRLLAPPQHRTQQA